LLMHHLRKWTSKVRKEGQMRQGRNYNAVTGAEEGLLASRPVTILVAMHKAMGKLDSCSYCVVGGGPELLVYKNPASSLPWIQQLFPLRSGRHTLTSFLSLCPYFLLRANDLTTTMEVLSYQPHSRKNSPFPYDSLPSASKLPTSSSSNPTSKQLSVLNQSQPSDVISRLRGIYYARMWRRLCLMCL
jgi:hypothetical protein